MNRVVQQRNQVDSVLPANGRRPARLETRIALGGQPVNWCARRERVGFSIASGERLILTSPALSAGSGITLTAPHRG
jgi:hypothetical protein